MPSDCKSTKPKSSKQRNSKPKSAAKSKSQGLRKSNSSRKSVTSRKGACKVSAPKVKTSSSTCMSLSENEQARELIHSLSQNLSKNSKQGQPVVGRPIVIYVTDEVQLEELFDVMMDLRRNLKIIHDSYQEIMNSLISLQRRRKPKGKVVEPLAASKVKQHSPEGKNTTDSMERFLDSSTREEAFSQLFARVDKLKVEMDPFMSCFDERNYLIRAQYQTNKITTVQHRTWKAEIHSLALIVDSLLIEYNKQVLGLFRLNSQAESQIDSSLGKAD